MVWSGAGRWIKADALGFSHDGIDQPFPEAEASYLRKNIPSRGSILTRHGLHLRLEVLIREANPLSGAYRDALVSETGRAIAFVEHGLSPEIRTARWQHQLTPYWKLLGGGCQLDHKMDDLIRAVGFEIGALQIGYIRGPNPWTFMYQGAATI